MSGAYAHSGPTVSRHLVTYVRQMTAEGRGFGGAMVPSWTQRSQGSGSTTW
jgi:hypothetical protein